MQQDRDTEERKQREKLHPRRFPEVLKGTEGKISKKESKKNILFIGIIPGVCKHKIPRNFGNYCKQQQIPAIFSAVMRMKKSFDDQETENRKSTSSDIADNTIESNSFSIDIKELRERRRIVAEYDCTCMIDQHGNTGKQFQHAAP